MMFKYIADVTMKRRSVMMNWKRKVWRRTQLPPMYFAKFQDYFKVLKYSGLSTPLARKVLMDNQVIFEIPLKDVREVLAICNKWHVDIYALYKNAKVFMLPIDIIEHRIMLLDEMGVEHIEIAFITSYVTAQWMRMSLFKATTKIPESVNLTQKMLQCLEIPPSAAPPLGPLNEHMSVKHYREQCWAWYLNWRLNLSKADKESMERIIHFMGSKSFRLMKNQLDLLYDNIGLTAEQILRTRCLGRGSYKELENTINIVKTYGGIEIRKLIRVKPRLSVVKCENAIKNKALLEEHGYTDKMIRLYPESLLVPYEDLKRRLDEINDTPELRVLKNNKRSLMLAKFIKTVQIRLEYLRHHNVNSVTVRAMTSDLKAFECLLHSGVDKTTGKEIGMSFSKIINLDAAEISRRIKKHPFWRTVDLASMHDVVAFLLQSFSPQDIADNIQLILYPKRRIAETLKNLPEMHEESEEKKLSGKRILATCLYEIERDVHFTGDGIWRRERKPRAIRFFTEQIEVERSKFNDENDIDPAQHNASGEN